MKIVFFNFLIVLVLALEVYSQETKKVLLNEFSASINTSDVKDKNSANQPGYGIGIFHSFETSKHVKLLVGLEFNHLSQYKLRVYDGHLASQNDITYNFNVLSIRFFPRIQFGSKIKVFIDAGPQIDIGLYSYWKGTLKYRNTSTYLIDSKSSTGTILYGVNPYICGGIGVMKRFKKFDLFIKSEYKIGLTKTYDILEINHHYLYYTLGIRRNSSH